MTSLPLVQEMNMETTTGHMLSSQQSAKTPCWYPYGRKVFKAHEFAVTSNLLLFQIITLINISYHEEGCWFVG